MKLTKNQVLLLAVGLVLLVVLLFIPRKLDFTSNSTSNSLAVPVDYNTRLKSLEDSLVKTMPETTVKVYTMLKKSTDETFANDTISKFWLANKIPALGAFYKEKIALTTGAIADFTDAGYKYYIATKFSDNPDLTSLLFNKAITCYQMVLQKEPGNQNAKLNLASCYVEGTSDPMKGITMLREVVQVDSNNIEAHLRLAMFAVQSKQYDKAIQRYEKILAIDPNYSEAYLYMGEVYASSNNKEKAIKCLETFKAKSNDALVINEINRYINNLKKN